MLHFRFIHCSIPFLFFLFVLYLKCLWRYCSIWGFDWHCWPCSPVQSKLLKTVRNPHGDLQPPTLPVCLWYQSTRKETTLVLGSSWSLTSVTECGQLEDHLEKSEEDVSLDKNYSFNLKGVNWLLLMFSYHLVCNGSVCTCISLQSDK